jgi:hypothetical protein
LPAVAVTHIREPTVTPIAIPVALPRLTDSRPISQRAVVAREPTHSVALAKEVRLNRMMTLDRIGQTWDSPCSAVVDGFPVNQFCQREEGERLKSIQGQARKALALGIEQMLRRCLAEIGAAVSASTPAKPKSAISCVRPTLVRLAPVTTS